MSKRKWILWMIAVISLSICAMPCWATNYYVATDGNDADDGLSWATAFVTIGQGITTAGSGDIIDVNVGTYYEKITMGGEIIRSTDPNDPNVVAATVIDANANGATITAGTGTLTGFTITHDTGSGNGVWVNDGSNLTVSNCEVRDNTDGIAHWGGSLTVENCKIYDNSSEGVYFDDPETFTIKNSIISDNGGPGIIFDYGDYWEGEAIIRNCTIVGNTNYGISNPYNYSAIDINNCIVWDNGDDLYQCSATYSCIQDGDSGTRNISSDPNFLSTDANDPNYFHISLDSPCINAGDPHGDYSGETDIDFTDRVNGCGVDIGADEGTGDEQLKGVRNITQNKLYSTIQDGIDDANNSDVIEVYPGTYYEKISLGSKNLTLQSIDPNDWDVVADTIIDANSTGSTVTTGYGGNNGTLAGFTIMHSSGTGDGVFSTDNTGCTVSKCIIRDNTNGMYLYGNPTVENCKIYDNSSAGVFVDDPETFKIKNSLIYNNGSGITWDYGEPSGDGNVVNCTIVGNSNYGIYSDGLSTLTVSNCIIWDNNDDLYQCSATYSCIQDGDSGTGNISSDPCFVDDANDDFHLKDVSYCVNAGDPSGDYSSEVDIDFTDRINGCRVDIGADEGTGDNQYTCVYNITQDKWYSVIGDAVSDANNSDEIEVYPGTYYEKPNLGFKSLTLQSIDPNDWDIVAATVIDANANGATVTAGTGTLTGFTIIHGTGTGDGVYVGDGGNLIVSNCVIRDNTYGTYLYGNPTVENCKIYDNSSGGVFVDDPETFTIKNSEIYNNGNSGILWDYGEPSGDGNVVNCTIVGNSNYGIYSDGLSTLKVSNCIIWDNSDDLYQCSATYSCIQDGDSGTGNIDDDPDFVNANGDDFHLSWGSPCIDGGDPNGSYSGETDIDGDYRVLQEWVDIGADEFRSVCNITQNKCYQFIQDAIDDANNGDVIEAYPGTYYEKINMGNKNLILQSIDPNDWYVVEDTVIDANANGATVTAGTGTVKGFTIIHDPCTGSGNGVWVNDGSNLTVSNCVARDNTGGIYHYGGTLTVDNCKVYDNSSEGVYVDGVDGLTVKSSLIYDNGAAGIHLEYDEPVSGITVRNCTIVGNTNYGIYDLYNLYTETISNCIIWDNGDDLYNCSATYSCIEDLDSGDGVIHSDPCFVDDVNDDYHLDSNSLCVNAGDPNGDYSGEMDIDFTDRVNGGRIDIGADEGTQASQYSVNRDYSYVLTVGMDVNDPNYDAANDYNTINEAIVAMNAKSPALAAGRWGCINIYPEPNGAPKTYVEHLNSQYPDGNDVPAHCDLIGMGNDIDDVIIQFGAITPPGPGPDGIRCFGDNVVSNLKLWNKYIPGESYVSPGIDFEGDGHLKDCRVIGLHGTAVNAAKNMVISGCPYIFAMWVTTVNVTGTFDISDSYIYPKAYSNNIEDPIGINAGSSGRIENVTISSVSASSTPSYASGLTGIRAGGNGLITIEDVDIDLQLTSKYHASQTAPMRVCGIWCFNSGRNGLVTVSNCDISVTGIEDTSDPNGDGAGVMVNGIYNDEYRYSGSGGRIMILDSSNIETSRTTGSNAEDGYEYLLNNESGELYVDFTSVTFDPNGPNDPNSYDPNYTNGEITAL